MTSDLCIEHWLDSISMKDYFPLFMGYEEIDSLFHLKEHDLEKIGVHRASDRHKMLTSLANLRDTAYPGRERTSSRVASLRRPPQQMASSSSSHSIPNSSNLSVDEPQRLPRSNSIKAKFGEFFKGIRLKRSATVATADVADSRAPSLSSSHVNVAEGNSGGGVSNSSSTHSLDRTDLAAQPWFHGMIMRKVADRALVDEGDFLVRESISKPGEHVLTAKWRGKTMHFVVNTVRWRTIASRESSPLRRHNTTTGASTHSLNAVGGGAPERGTTLVYKFERDGFPSIPELVEHYVKTRNPVSDVSGCVIRRGVPRERRPPSPLTEARKTLNLTSDSPNSGASRPMATSNSASGRGGKETRALDSRVNGHSAVITTVADVNVPPPVRRLDPEYQRHLPDLEYVRTMCSTVLNQSSEEMGRHLTRVDLHLAQLFSPEDVAEGNDGAGRSPSRNGDNVPGGIVGLAVVNLPQGKQLRELLLERFHSISLWSAAAVVGAGDLAKRKNVLKKLIDMSHYLQGDALANVHSFMAIMRGLQSPQVKRLLSTWSLLKRNDANTAKLYEMKLVKLALDVAAGKPTHLHSGVSLPYVEPLLELLERKPLGSDEKNWGSDWESNLDHFALDALQSHLYSSRSLSISCPMYSDAGFKRLSGHKVIRELDLYFRNDWPTNLLASISFKAGSFSEKVAKFQVMLSALSEHAEPTQA